MPSKEQIYLLIPIKELECGGKPTSSAARLGFGKSESRTEKTAAVEDWLELVSSSEALNVERCNKAQRKENGTT